MNLLKAAAAALVLGASMAMPSGLGQRYTPSFERSVVYNGDGNKLKPPDHPRHNSALSDYERGKFRRQVEATHSWQGEDPRDDKYLHSHARAMRGLKRALAARAA